VIETIPNSNDNWVIESSHYFKSNSLWNISVRDEPYINDWNIEFLGIRGATGNIGATGATGAIGERGATGAKGDSGIGLAPLTSTSARTNMIATQNFVINQDSTTNAFKAGMYVKFLQSRFNSNFMTGTIITYTGTNMLFTSDYSEGTPGEIYTYTEVATSSTINTISVGNKNFVITSGNSDILSYNNKTIRIALFENESVYLEGIATIAQNSQATLNVSVNTVNNETLQPITVTTSSNDWIIESKPYFNHSTASETLSIYSTWYVYYWQLRHIKHMLIVLRCSIICSAYIV
jgi:hypothetical protein